jgi:hypothetical protein
MTVVATAQKLINCSEENLTHYYKKRWAFCAIKEVYMLRDGFPNG